MTLTSTRVIVFFRSGGFVGRWRQSSALWPSTWPGQASVVDAAMRDAVPIEVEELERDQIVQLVEAAGVAGPPDLQRLIVDQARGCAGLAVTLAQACVAGRAYDVATGRALLDDLAGWFGRTLGDESRHALGVLALAGEHGADTDAGHGRSGIAFADSQ